MTEEEIARINAHINIAYHKAERAAIEKFGAEKGLHQLAFIDRLYHQYMNEHAVKLGLRIV